MEMIKSFIREEDGVTAVEYGLIAALIAVVIAAAVQAVGSNLNTVFGIIRDCLANPSATTCAPAAAPAG